MSDIENRVMELEIKNAHQEDTIEHLNQIIIEHQALIDNLARHLEQLQNKINTIQEDNSKEAPEPPPPHY
ncbi:MAG: SlyX family protein [gamma proteobacterium symbiont of Lucinoma myriamae]|nr:SlyX family protein [gamma proteobacterium symbiont of Lucinoma myriamae]MCU7819591.1 SlyX family protein [gamma proteobacterium symbiont of Lucinoma myriamae]MCU7832560.1 SlyX family protein [gamma proteobacterium symbiont of Lucinoma myriamae]